MQTALDTFRALAPFLFLMIAFLIVAAVAVHWFLNAYAAALEAADREFGDWPDQDLAVLPAGVRILSPADAQTDIDLAAFQAGAAELPAPSPVTRAANFLPAAADRALLGLGVGIVAAEVLLFFLPAEVIALLPELPL